MKAAIKNWKEKIPKSVKKDLFKIWGNYSSVLIGSSLIEGYLSLALDYTDPFMVQVNIKWTSRLYIQARVIDIKLLLAKEYCVLFNEIYRETFFIVKETFYFCQVVCWVQMKSHFHLTEQMEHFELCLKNPLKYSTILIIQPALH